MLEIFYEPIFFGFMIFASFAIYSFGYWNGINCAQKMNHLQCHDHENRKWNL